MFLPMSCTSPLTVHRIDLALRAHAVGAEPELLLLHERLEVGDRARFIARALLTTCGRNILPGAEQVADDLHPGHQRALDHVQRPVAGRAGLLGVLLDELVDPVHERVREALLDGGLAPRRSSSFFMRRP